MIDSTILSKFDRETIREIIHCFRRYQPPQYPHKCDNTTEDLIAIIAKLYDICKSNNAENSKSAMQEMGVDGDIIEMFYEPVSTNSLDSCEYNWRLDISVPQASAILLNIRKNGESVSFRMDLPTFHKLRFNSSLLMRELQTLQSHISR